MWSFYLTSKTCFQISKVVVTKVNTSEGKIPSLEFFGRKAQSRTEKIALKNFTCHSGLGRIEALKFCRRYMIFLRKKTENFHIWDPLTSFWSLFCTPRSEHEAHWERNFGVRTYVQSVPLIQTIHTKTIACSLSSLLWLLRVHFEE